MNDSFQPLDDAMQAELARIRQALERHPPARQPPAAVATEDAAPPTAPDQTDRIFKRLCDWLFDDEQRQTLGRHPWALFFIQAVCLLDTAPHQAGPSCGAAADDEGPPAGLDTQWRRLGLGDAGRAAIVTDICRRLSTAPQAGAVGLTNELPRYAGSQVPTDLIAAGIRLSRSLELKRPATFAEICAYLPADVDPADLAEAFEVDAVRPHPYFAATVQVKLRCRHPELHRALKHHECAVLENLNAFNQRVRPRFLFSELIYEIEPQGYQPVDLKFSVDTSAALQLFMGNRLYADKRVFLRELIQNAVDACNLRKLADDTHAAAISLRFDEQIRQITIRDNGIGMDRQWLEKYFLSIGISFYQSDEIRSVNRDPRISIGFISQFGIGFLSSFLVAEKIVVKTRKRGCPGLVVTITSLKQYFDVRPADEDLPPGTAVTLHLRPSEFNYSRSMEFAGYLMTNIRFLEIPVDFIDERGQRRVIGNEPLDYASQYAGVGDFVAAVPFDDAEGYVYLRTKVHDGRIFSLDSALGGVSVFQDGIFVRQDETLLPEGARQNVVGRINLRGRDKCDLSMDRNRIFWSADRKNQVRERILLALADAANRVVARLEAQGTDERVNTSVINHLSIFFEFSDVNDVVHERLCDPLRRIVEKRFRNFVRIHFEHTRSATGVPGADGYGERWQRRILSAFGRKR